MSTTNPDRAVYVRCEHVVSRAIAGENILVPVAGNLADLLNIYGLNDVGKFIWEQVDGNRSVGDIVRAVSETFEVDEATAREDCDGFLKTLLDAGLIAGK